MTTRRLNLVHVRWLLPLLLGACADRSQAADRRARYAALVGGSEAALTEALGQPALPRPQAVPVSPRELHPASQLAVRLAQHPVYPGRQRRALVLRRPARRHRGHRGQRRSAPAHQRALRV